MEASRLLRSCEINLEDSISNASLRTVTSCSSCLSRLSSTSQNSSARTRARAEALRTILKAEFTTLKRLHEIEEEKEIAPMQNSIKTWNWNSKGQDWRTGLWACREWDHAKLLPKKKQNKESVSFLQPQATPSEAEFIADEAAAVQAKPDVHEPIETVHEYSNQLAADCEFSQHEFTICCQLIWIFMGGFYSASILLCKKT